MQASVRKQAFLHSRKYLLAHGRVGETPFPSIKPDGVADMATVGYVCIGTNDFDRATAFYDALLGEFGEQRSEEHTSELQSLMRNSYSVFCLKKKTLRFKYINKDNTLIFIIYIK